MLQFMLLVTSLFTCEKYINPLRDHAHLEEGKLNFFILLFLLLNHRAFLLIQLAGLNRYNCNINLMDYHLVI